MLPIWPTKSCQFGNILVLMTKQPRIGPRMPVRAYIMQWREAKGLTQQQLGDRLGVDKGTISRWENAERIPNLNVLGAICEALDIQPWAIYRMPGTKSPEDMLAIASEPVRREAAEYIEFLLRKHAK